MITAILLAAALLAPGPFPVRVAQDDVNALLASIERLRDEVPLEVIEALAEDGTREGAEALVAGYDQLGSILVRREVVRALARYDGIAEAEQVALQKIADVAATESAVELHEEAVDLLADCPSLGRFFLRRIVDSFAPSTVRERAMQRHVETSDGGSDDLDWYERLFEAHAGDKQSKEPQPRSLTRIRELALEQLAPGLKDTQLVDLAEEKRRDVLAPSLAGIRRIALAELFRRESKKGRTVAEAAFKDVTEIPENRIAAARHLFELQGTKLAGRFFSEGDRDPSVVPMALRMALADMLAEMDHASTDKKLIVQLKQAEGVGALFCMRALRGVEDDRITEELLRLVDSKDARARVAAIEALGEAGGGETEQVLERVLGQDEPQRVLIAVLGSLSALRAGNQEWEARLVGYAQTEDERSELRNAALRSLAGLDRAAHEQVFFDALSHPDWSTRATALEVLTEMRSREATGVIVARMGAEQGAMLSRFADALWGLTGQPFRRSASTWQRWWDDAGGDFEPIAADELARRADEEERRRLSESSKAASFFGVRVESRRVLFVLDVSGSMDFSVAGEEVEEDEERETVRMDVAKEELIAALSSLDDDTLFNLITFSGGVHFWKRDGIVAAVPSTKDESIEYVARLNPGGGTNLYGALAAAFADRDVDTIFVLSDGEPAGGAIDDPFLIREEVVSWNEHRHVTIHAIAIGGNLEILEWLAEDSGGYYVKYE